MEDSTEVAKKQAEWQLEIESLDQKESELHQSQLRLVWEQTATFIHDSVALRKEVASLRLAQENHASVAERVERLENLFRHSSSKIAKDSGETDKRLEDLQIQVNEDDATIRRLQAEFATFARHSDQIEQTLEDGFSKHSRELRDTRSHLETAHLNIRKSSEERQEGSVFVAERIDCIERMIGDVIGRHTKELKSVHVKVNQVHGRVGEQHACIKDDHESMREKLVQLEKAIREISDKHDRDIGPVKSQQARILNDVKLHGTHEESNQQRIELLEKSFQDSVDKHMRDLSLSRNSIDQIQIHLGSQHALLVQNASLQDRIVRVETAVSEFSQQTSKDTAGRNAMIEQLRNRVCALEATNGPAVEALRSGHAALQADRQRADAQRRSESERLEHLERLVSELSIASSSSRGDTQSKIDEAHQRISDCEKLVASLDSNQKAIQAHHKDDKDHNFAMRQNNLQVGLSNHVDQHAYLRDLDSLKVAHERLALCVKQKLSENNYADIASRLEIIEKFLAKESQMHSQNVDVTKNQIEVLQGRMLACETQSATTAKSYKLQAPGAAATSATERRQQAALTDRVDDTVQVVEDLGARHQRELAATNSKIDQLHARLAANERSISTLKETHAAHSALIQSKAHKPDTDHDQLLKERQQNTHWAQVSERVEKHSNELESLKLAHGRLARDFKIQDAKLAGVDTRLDNVDQAEAALCDRHKRDLGEMHVRINALHGKVSDDAARHEDHIRSLIANEKETHALHQMTLKERMDHLENVLDESRTAHSKSVESVQTNCVSNLKEIRTVSKVHGDIEDRLSHLESITPVASAQRNRKLELGEEFGKNSASEPLLRSGISGKPISIPAAIAELKSQMLELQSRSIESVGQDQKQRNAKDVLAVQELAKNAANIEAIDARVILLEGFQKHAKTLLGKSGLARTQDCVESPVRSACIDPPSGKTDSELGTAGLKSMRDSLCNRMAGFESDVDCLRKHVAKVSKLPNDRSGEDGSDRLEPLEKALKWLAQSCENEHHHVNQRLANELRAVRQQFADEVSARNTLDIRISGKIEDTKIELGRLHQLFAERTESERQERQNNEIQIREELKKYNATLESDGPWVARLALRVERCMFHETANERVDSLQKSVNIFDKLIRTDMEERSKENRRIWDAIDNHTHDVSSQADYKHLFASDSQASAQRQHAALGS